MMTNIVVMTGLPASGKSTVANVFRDKWRANIIDVGEALQQHLDESGIGYTTKASVGPMFLKHFDASDIFSILAKSIKPDVVTVFDAVRLAITCKQFKQWNAATCICCMQATDLQRSLRRAKELRIKGWSEVEIQQEWQRYSKYDGEYEDIKGLADHIIHNDGSLEELYEQVQTIAIQFSWSSSTS